MTVLGKAPTVAKMYVAMPRALRTEAGVLARTSATDIPPPVGDFCYPMLDFPRTPRHIIGDAGVYLEWQHSRRVRGAVSAPAS